MDFLGDQAHYANRSVGLSDVMFSQFQTTPFKWFDSIPWWAALSFHDHPTPLLFVIQHLFLRVSENAFFAKLPYALMTLGTILTGYFLSLKLFDKKTALWTALALALSNGLIWAGREAHMESGVLFFITLSIFFFFKFIEDRKYWWQFGVVLGLLLLTKYSSWFILPVFAIYLLIFKREFLKNKRLYMAGVLALFMSLPVIVYNVGLYKSRGHLDFQLSRLFGISSPWSSSGAAADAQNFTQAISGLGQMNSWPYLILALIGLYYLIKKHQTAWFFCFYIISLLIFILLVGSDPRFLVFAALPLAIGLGYILSLIPYLVSKQNKPITDYRLLITAVVLFLPFVYFNQHTFKKPPHALLSSSHQSQNFGYAQLDKTLTKYINRIYDLRTFNTGRGTKIKKHGLERFNHSTNQVNNFNDLNHILVYDDALNWFPRQWVLERRTFYHNLPLYPPEFLAELQRQFGGSEKHKTYHLIKTFEGTSFDVDRKQNGIAAQMEKFFIQKGVEPGLVYNSRGEVAFKIYRYEGVFGFGTE